MSLQEIARFTDVYEADLAAAFLASHDVEVSVTERFQTTVDPLMQRALGIRLMAPASQAAMARDLLARVRAGEFVEPEGDDPPEVTPVARGVGGALAIAAWSTGGFWGSSLPRRLRPLAWQGMLLSAVMVAGVVLAVFLIAKVLLDPPTG